MKKVILITLAVLALSFALFAQQAEKPGMGNHKMMMNKDATGHDMMGMHQDWTKGLNLTDAQKKKFEIMKTDHKKFMNLKQAEMKNLHIDKQKAMRAEDYAKVKQLNKSIVDLELLMENARVDHKSAMMKELTAEQKAKIKDIMPMHKGMNPGMGKGMKKGDCIGDCKGDCK